MVSVSLFPSLLATLDPNPRIYHFLHYGATLDTLAHPISYSVVERIQKFLQELSKVHSVLQKRFSLLSSSLNPFGETLSQIKAVSSSITFHVFSQLFTFTGCWISSWKRQRHWSLFSQWKILIPSRKSKNPPTSWACLPLANMRWKERTCKGGSGAQKYRESWTTGLSTFSLLVNVDSKFPKNGAKKWWKISFMNQVSWN